MTRDELKEVLKNNVTTWNRLEAIMTAVDAYTSALLPQADVLRLRELLVMLDNIEKGLVTEETLNNRVAIQRVLKLIDAMPPVA